MSEEDDVKLTREILVKSISRNAISKPKLALILEFILREFEKQPSPTKKDN